MHVPSTEAWTCTDGLTQTWASNLCPVSCSDTAAPVSTKLSDVWPKLVCEGLCAKTPLWWKPQRARGIWISVLKERLRRSSQYMNFYVCAQQKIRRTPSTEPFTGGEHTSAWDPTLTEWEATWVKSVNVWGSVCLCKWRLVRPKPYLTFWLSMPPREPLGLGLQTQARKKKNISFCYVSSNLFTITVF